MDAASPTTNKEELFKPVINKKKKKQKKAKEIENLENNNH
jgi:hypothetical protein